MKKNYIKIETIQVLWNTCENDKQKDTLSRFMDIYRISVASSKNPRSEKVEVSTFEKAKILYDEVRKLNRQNDKLVVLDNNYDLYLTEYHKRLQKKNDKQEEKVKKLAKQMGFKIVYYSHLATLQSIKTENDINLCFML